MWRVFGRLGSAGLMLLGHVSCGGDGPATRRVAASIFPLYDAARRIAGKGFHVDLVLPPGQSDHFFDPKPKDVAVLSEATLILSVGLGLDQWLEGMVKGAGGGRAKVLELGPLVDPILVPEPTGQEVPDAHFWLDPVRMQRAVDLMVDAFRGLDPEDGPGYRARGDEFKRQLNLLHEEISSRAATWRRREIVTFHGSFYSFADRYHLKVVAVVEPVPGREPTARYLADTMEAVRRSQAAAIFSEPQLERGLAQALAREVGLPLLELDPVGGGPGADSYEKLLRHNVDILEQVLR